MLSKCANPACTRSFRYLHEGKLFCREPARDSRTGAVAKGEWYWLCDHCFYMCHPGAALVRCTVEKGQEEPSEGSAEAHRLGSR